MVLKRLGNKQKLAKFLQSNFPPHKMRIELFFGAGGSYFYLPKPKYAIINDLDDDVTNLYLVIINNINELISLITITPISVSLLNYWKKNLETDPIRKAVRFLFLSNFTYMGKGDTLRLSLDNVKKSLLNNIERTLVELQNVKILNTDFRNVLSKISFSEGVNDKDNCFIYMDPIYFETQHYYKVPNWTFNDTLDCLDIMIECGIKCAMSEFDHPKVIEAAQDRGLNIIFFKERKNLKNRRVEILITNYKNSNLFN